MRDKLDVAFKVAVLLAFGGLAYAQYRLFDELAFLSLKHDNTSRTLRHQQLKIWDKLNPGAQVPTTDACGPLWPHSSADPKQCEAFIARRDGYIP